MLRPCSTYEKPEVKLLHAPRRLRPAFVYPLSNLQFGQATSQLFGDIGSGADSCRGAWPPPPQDEASEQVCPDAPAAALAVAFLLRHPGARSNCCSELLVFPKRRKGPNLGDFSRFLGFGEGSRQSTQRRPWSVGMAANVVEVVGLVSRHLQEKRERARGKI